MNLNIANINAIVENGKLKPVKTTRMFSQSVQADSLFSEEIFGKFGSSERKKTFAYIELGTKIIHPEALQQVFLSIDPLLSKYIMSKQNCSIQNGKLIPDNEEGVSGVYHFIKNYSKIDFSLFKKKKPKEINWIVQNSKKIFIDKYLIIPAAFRDIQFSKTAGSSQIQYAELNELYEKTIRMSKTLTSVADSEDLIQSMTQSIQISVNDINKWFKERMKGKYGVVRGGLMKKSTDFSGRLVITTDNKLELGEVGLPWQVVLRIYEYFTLHELQKNKDYLSLLQSFLKINTPIDTFQLKNLIKKLNATPNILSPMLKDYFIEVAKKIAEGKVILYKRDPVENRHSYVAATIRVTEDGFVMSLNPLDLKRNGADHDGDAIAIYGLYTKEAVEEAKQLMHPKYSKSVWMNTVSNKDISYGAGLLDASAAIYNATLS